MSSTNINKGNSVIFNFNSFICRELSFRKGDTIYIRRQIDPNWYEGEHNAMIGLLPASYIEVSLTSLKINTL